MSEQASVQNEEDYSCGRAFAHKVNADEWLNLVESHTVTEKDLHTRLEQNWTAVAGVSGLVTGFTYVVANTDITFTQGGPLSEYRHDLFGFFSMLSFLTALMATLFSAGLFGMINLLGEENTNWFVIQNWYIIDLPLVSAITSIALMLVSAMISIGGIVEKWVYYTILAIGVIFGCCFSIVFCRIQNQMYKRTFAMKNKKMMSQQMELNNANDAILTTTNDKTD